MTTVIIRYDSHIYYEASFSFEKINESPISRNTLVVNTFFSLIFKTTINEQINRMSELMLIYLTSLMCMIHHMCRLGNNIKSTSTCVDDLCAFEQVNRCG